MAKQKQPEPKPEKYTVEFKNEQKEVVEVWHYNTKKFSRGPVLVEILENNKKASSKKSKKQIL